MPVLKEAVVTESFADQSGKQRVKRNIGFKNRSCGVYLHMWRSEESGSIYFCKRTSFYRCCGKSRRLYQKADKLSVNLAEVVKDGTQLTIEKKRKRKAAQEEQSSHGMSSADEAGKINLNTASAEQLMKLSG